MPEDEKLVYTLSEVADLLQVCSKTVYRMLERGDLTRLPHVRKALIPKASLERFVAAAVEPAA